MCLLCGWRESDHDVLIIYGVLHANFVYTLGPASKSGAGRCLLSLHQSLEESVFYGYLCLFCCLAMVAIVSLVKAKHTEKASFDIDRRLHFHMYMPCPTTALSLEEGAAPGPEGDESPHLMLP